MPESARFFADIQCSKCGTHLLNSARFQWGVVPWPSYRAGESIRWLRDGTGNSVEPFRIGELGPTQYVWNCGLSTCRNVLLLDEDFYFGNHKLACVICESAIVAVIAKIVEGRFVSACAATAPEVSEILGMSVNKAKIVIVGDDGSLLPREDWFDHALHFVDIPGAIVR